MTAVFVWVAGSATSPATTYAGWPRRSYFRLLFFPLTHARRRYTALFDLDQWMSAGGSSNTDLTLATLDDAAAAEPESLPDAGDRLCPFWNTCVPA